MEIDQNSSQSSKRLVKIAVPKDILDIMMKAVPDMKLVPMVRKGHVGEPSIYGVVQHNPARSSF